MRLIHLLASGFVVVFSLSGFAATPPGFNQASWNQFVAKVAATGSPMLAANAELHVFSHVVPNDVSKPHQADYFSTLGERDNAGTYTPFSVSVVNENWQKDSSGNWIIDQWIFDLTLMGDLRRVYHGRVVESQSGSVLSDESFPVGSPTDSANLQLLGHKLDQWLTWGL